MQGSVAILWDIENVTPSVEMMFLDGLWEYAESLGRVVVSFAYADWSKPGFKRLGPDLAQRHFSMLHVPYKTKRQHKNGSDMQLVADALDLLRFHPHIDTFLLLSGDSDFRPLLLTLRRSGKRVHLLCDIKTAAQDLLMLADSFTDYRDVIPNNDEEQDEQEAGREERQVVLRPVTYWFERLAETAALLLAEKVGSNVGSLKVRMKMLNTEFDEARYGYRSWSSFIAAAVQHNYIKIEERDLETMFVPGSAYQVQGANSELNRAFHILAEEVTSLTSTNGGRQFHSYSVLSQRLYDRGVNVRNIGFNQFKKFISAAEARGVVETKIENFKHYVGLPSK